MLSQRSHVNRVAWYGNLKTLDIRGDLGGVYYS